MNATKFILDAIYAGRENEALENRIVQVAGRHGGKLVGFCGFLFGSNQRIVGLSFSSKASRRSCREDLVGLREHLSFEERDL